MASGSTLCPTCRKLVGINDEICYNCGRKSPGKRSLLGDMHKQATRLGFEKIIAVTCIAMFLASLAWDAKGIAFQGLLNFLSPSIPSLFLFGASGSYPVFTHGNWWTVFSATLLHGSLIHIALNLYWLNYFLPACEHVYGTSRSIIGFTAASVVGFGLTSIMGLLVGPIPYIGGAQITIGASAAIFGLLGLLVASGGALGQVMKTNALIFAAFGFIIPGVDNWSHAGGFLGGYLAGILFQRLPSNPRVENIVAMLCILAFVVSVIISVIFNMTFAQNINT